MGKKQKVLLIVGPTSAGKSALAVEIAREFQGEVISADSRQVYKGLDIGTGKITRREMRGIPHHLLDVASPKRIFTAHDYITKSRAAIADISARGKLPIICGGTGFYIDTLLGRVTLPDVPADKALRMKLERKTAAQLFTILRKRDPRRAETIEPQNQRRLIRALEIAAALGRIPNEKPARRRLAGFYETLWIGLSTDPADLRRRINARLKERLRRGMIAEARRLHARGLSYKRMQALGLEYRSLARFLRGKISRAELESELRSTIWRYARRQIRYWKRNTDIRWFKLQQRKNVKKSVKEFLSGGR